MLNSLCVSFNISEQDHLCFFFFLSKLISRVDQAYNKHTTVFALLSLPAKDIA